MSTVRLFFSDGTHEDRDDSSHVFFACPHKHPRTAAPSTRGHFAVAALHQWPPVESCQLAELSRFYRITSGLRPRETLRGNWATVRVETWRQEAERLRLAVNGWEASYRAHGEWKGPSR